MLDFVFTPRYVELSAMLAFGNSNRRVVVFFYVYKIVSAHWVAGKYGLSGAPYGSEPASPAKYFHTSF
jgi:hypothetical protein